VVPTAHFCMGGVVTNATGQTGIKGLYAVGEVTAGAHGANRLGGNALAEIFTMGDVVGEAAGIHATASGAIPPIEVQADAEKRRLENAFTTRGSVPGKFILALKKMMWEKVGIIRLHSELSKAMETLGNPSPEIRVTSPAELIRFLEYHNMRRISQMVCKAALARTESRGSHFRVDFPSEDNARWLRNIVIQKNASGIDCHAIPAKAARTDGMALE
jgi:succinate dehydrogenase/fumarate reductase flavoprotein subunit